jgi:hypothetical protein
MYLTVLYVYADADADKIENTLYTFCMYTIRASFVSMYTSGLELHVTIHYSYVTSHQVHPMTFDRKLLLLFTHERSSSRLEKYLLNY